METKDIWVHWSNKNIVETPYSSSAFISIIVFVIGVLSYAVLSDIFPVIEKLKFLNIGIWILLCSGLYWFLIGFYLSKITEADELRAKETYDFLFDQFKQLSSKIIINWRERKELNEADIRMLANIIRSASYQYAIMRKTPSICNEDFSNEATRLEGDKYKNLMVDPPTLKICIHNNSDVDVTVGNNKYLYNEK